MITGPLTKRAPAMARAPRIGAGSILKPVLCPTCGAKRAKEWHLLCPTCWAGVPKSLQDEVWAAFREEKGGARHHAAIAAVLRFVRDRQEAERNA